MNTGKVIGINGNMATVEFTDNISLNEVAYIILGDSRLKAEVIRVNGKEASLQVFEMTGGTESFAAACRKVRFLFAARCLYECNSRFSLGIYSFGKKGRYRATGVFCRNCSGGYFQPSDYGSVRFQRR